MVGWPKFRWESAARNSVNQRVNWDIRKMGLNQYQQIFTVFFAIFWGTTASVQGRWKMFNYALCRWVRPQVRNRLILSHLLGNLCPLIFFAYAMGVLNRYDDIDWTVPGTMRIVIRSVPPAFAVFGFYRLWVGIMEIRPQWYYRQHDRCPTFGGIISHKIDPTMESLDLREDHARLWCWINIKWAMIYVLFALLGPWFP
jgi:hypothetical protein